MKSSAAVISLLAFFTSVGAIASDFSGSAPTLLANGSYSNGTTNSANFKCDFTRHLPSQVGEAVEVSCAVFGSSAAVPYPVPTFELAFDNLFNQDIPSLFGKVFSSLTAKCTGTSTSVLMCVFSEKQLLPPNDGCSGYGCLPKFPTPRPGCVGYECLP